MESSSLNAAGALTFNSDLIVPEFHRIARICILIFYFTVSI
ncbi:MAG: hypothetical protein ACOYB8_08225 [Eubacteriaceae bacterium]